MASKKTEEKIIDEQYKLVDGYNPDFKEITEELNKPNIFRILGLETMETRHSNFLAYLFDEKQNHGLGAQVLNRFFDGIGHGELKNDSYSVEREHFFIDKKGKQRYIDVLLVGKKNIVCVENKVLSFQHDGQLDAYKGYINELSSMKGISSLRYIYLTPTKEIITDKVWEQISYKPVVEILNKITQENMIKEFKIKGYIEEYLNVLRRDIMHTDKELIDKCWSIIKGKEKEFLTIYENTIGNKRNLMRNIILDALNELGIDKSENFIEVKSTASTEFKFVTEGLKSTKNDCDNSKNLREWKSPYRIVYWLQVIDSQEPGQIKIKPVLTIKSNCTEEDREYREQIKEKFGVTKNHIHNMPLLKEKIFTFDNNFYEDIEGTKNKFKNQIENILSEFKLSLEDRL